MSYDTWPYDDLLTNMVDATGPDDPNPLAVVDDRHTKDAAQALNALKAHLVAEPYAGRITEILLSTSPVAAGGLNQIGGIPLNTFSDSTNQYAIWNVAIPEDWATYDIDVEHCSTSGTGPVVVRTDIGWVGDGDAVTVTAGVAAATITAATTLNRDTVASDLAVTADKLLTIRLFRLPADAADTLGAVWNIRAVRVVQAS